VEDHPFDPTINQFIAAEANKDEAYILLALLVYGDRFRLALPVTTRAWLKHSPGALKEIKDAIEETLDEVARLELDDLEVRRKRNEL
jgi:hypothetical protein